MLHESLDGPFTVAAFCATITGAVSHLHEATLEVSVSTTLQRFAMFLSRRYGIILDDALSSYLLQYSSSAKAVPWQ